jgi:hypothetical protein
VKPADENNLIEPLSSHKPARLNNEQKAQFNLTQKLQEILVGCGLGDLYMQKRKDCVNAKLFFEQSIEHKDYLLHLNEEFKDFCPSQPAIKTHTLKDKPGIVYSSLRLSTYSLPCFNQYYDSFYPNGKKVVPSNIEVLLTARVLAY